MCEKKVSDLCLEVQDDFLDPLSSGVLKGPPPIPRAGA